MSKKLWIPLGGLVVIILVAGVILYTLIPPLSKQLPPEGDSTVVTLTNPVNGSSATLNQETAITAEALGSQPVSALQLWVDGALWQTKQAPNSGLAQFSAFWTWMPTEAGPHTLLVRALDAQGGQAQSNLVRVNVNPAQDQTNAQPSPDETTPPSTGPEQQPPAPPAGSSQPVSDTHPGKVGFWLGKNIDKAFGNQQAPQAPVLSATVNACNVELQIQDKSNNEFGYLVYRADPKSVDYVKVATLGAGKGTLVYTDKNLYGSLSYYVAAYNGVGQSPSNPVSLNIQDSNCLTPQWSALSLNDATLTPTQPVDKLYCYISLNSGPWTRLPAVQNTFLTPTNGSFDLSPYLKNLPLSPNGAQLDLECWGWQGGSLQLLGKFSQKIPPQLGQPVQVNLGNINFGAMPQMTPLSGGLPDGPVPTPVDFKLTGDPTTCLQHGVILLFCKAVIKDKYAVFVWTPVSCWPGNGCNNNIGGYNLYEVQPDKTLVLRKKVNNPDQTTAAISPPAWPDTAGTQRCFVVTAFTSDTGDESPPSNTACFEFAKLGIQTISLSPTDMLWRYHSHYEGCDWKAAVGPGMSPYDLPPNTIVAGYEHGAHNCDLWNAIFRGAVSFDPSQIPGKLVSARFKFDLYSTEYEVAPDVATNTIKSCASYLMLATEDWHGNPYGDKPITIPAKDYTKLNSNEPDVTPVVKEWLQGTTPNYGFVLRGSQENITDNHGENACASVYNNLRLDVAYYTP
jgi:hypothetical protein